MEKSILLTLVDGRPHFNAPASAFERANVARIAQHA
jgi:hypothetical protein